MPDVDLDAARSRPAPARRRRRRCTRRRRPGRGGRSARSPPAWSRGAGPRAVPVEEHRPGVAEAERRGQPWSWVATTRATLTVRSPTRASRLPSASMNRKSWACRPPPTPAATVSSGSTRGVARYSYPQEAKLSTNASVTARRRCAAAPIQSAKPPARPRAGLCSALIWREVYAVTHRRLRSAGARMRRCQPWWSTEAPAGSTGAPSAPRPIAPWNGPGRGLRCGRRRGAGGGGGGGAGPGGRSLFNAGTGAVLTATGGVELDAGVMVAAGLRTGAVAGVTDFAHPVELARAVLDDGRHVLLSGAGASRFGIERGLTRTDPARLVGAARRHDGSLGAHGRRGLPRRPRRPGGGRLHRRHRGQAARAGGRQRALRRRLLRRPRRGGVRHRARGGFRAGWRDAAGRSSCWRRGWRRRPPPPGSSSSSGPR